MPWRCPACSEQIHHSEFEPKPRVGAHYRCHIRRLELIVDPKTEKFVLAPIETAADTKSKRSRPR